MAITAATAGVNRIIRGGPGRTLFAEAKPVLSSAVTYYQGDLIYLDTSAHLLKPVAATGNAATFVGISDNTVISGNLAGPYDGLTPVNAAQSSPGIAGPVFGVVASLILKTSDAFNAGDKVYVTEGGTTQTVTSADPGNAAYIGIFVGTTVASAAAGQQGAIYIVSRYPAVSL